MFARRLRLLCLLFFLALNPARGAEITIAAAADLKFALDEIVRAYQVAHPADRVSVVYGSSGKFHTQIRQGAPYDLYFSADIAYPRALVEEGLAVAPVVPYARGRIVLYARRLDAARMQLEDLLDPGIKRIALANPRHAPYGRAAEQALRARGLWERLTPKLVYGENVGQAAQFVETGNADVGLIALALALSPTLAREGAHALIPEALHDPIEQGFVITRRAVGNESARRFAEYMVSPAARRILVRYGFVLPGEAAR